MSEPIRIPCEGGLRPGIQLTPDEVLCRMCGRLKLTVDGVVVPHMRPDPSAMIKRGDFDE